MWSREFVTGVRKILKKRGYNPSPVKYDRGCWKFILSKMDENVRLLYRLIPWLIHERKLKLPRKSQKSFIEVMKTFIDRIYISNTHIVELVRNAREKCGSSRLIKQLNERFNLQLNTRKANRWLYENNRVTLRTVFHLCQLVDYSIFPNIIQYYF